MKARHLGRSFLLVGLVLACGSVLAAESPTGPPPDPGTRRQSVVRVIGWHWRIASACLQHGQVEDRFSTSAPARCARGGKERGTGVKVQGVRVLATRKPR